MPQVQMPDGTVVEMPDQIDPALGARLRAFHTATAPAPEGMHKVTDDSGQPALRKDFGLRDVAQSVLDLPGVGTAANAAVGAWNTGVKAVSGLAGLITGGNADVVTGTRDALSVEPARTRDPLTTIPAAAAEAAAAPIERAVDTLPNGPQTVVRGLAEAIPDVAAIAGARAPIKGVASAAREARAPVSGAAKASGDDVLGTLRSAGYQFRPSDVKAMKPGEKVPGTFREGLQEPAALKKDFTLENQANTTRLAAEDLGLPKKTALMEKDYADLRKPHFAKYDEVNAAVYKTQPPPDFQATMANAHELAGFKPTDRATPTQIISALRKQERKGLRSDDAVIRKQGEAAGEAADAVEGAVSQRLESLGEDKLHSEYQNSRQALAKINDYENATRGGQVDAQAMRRIDERSPGRLSGHAKIIADAADYAKNVVRQGQNATGAASSVKADTIAGMAKKVGAKVLMKLPGMDVTRPSFQDKFGRTASTDVERQSLRDYGKRAPRPAPVAAPEPFRDLGAGSVDFTPTAGVAPARSLASDLELAPEPVANSVRLPEAPSTLTADTPPVHVTPSGLNFQGGPDQNLVNALAGELGIEIPTIGGERYTPPNFASQMAPDLNTLVTIAEQLGLIGETPQPSLMTPVKEPVPYGPRVALESPPGRVGKLKKGKK